MHRYVATMESRRKVIFRLALLSVLISIGIGSAIHHYSSLLSPYVAPPGALAIFGVIFALYDRVLWRAKPFGWRFSPIPNLSGLWEGYVDIRSPDGAGRKCKGRIKKCKGQVRKYRCHVVINQTWSRIAISFETEFSRSKSLMASIGRKEDPDGGLRSEYDVTPKPGIPVPGEEAVPRHFGMAHLVPVRSDWSHLTGEFYNDRSFQRWGVYAIERIAHKV